MSCWTQKTAPSIESCAICDAFAVAVESVELDRAERLPVEIHRARCITYRQPRRDPGAHFDNPNGARDGVRGFAVIVLVETGAQRE